MLILIAESKTMAPCNATVSPQTYSSHRPALEADADMIMESLRGVAANVLAEDVKLSMPMVNRLQQMVYEFPNKALGAKAIEAFTGVVFKAFDYPTLNSAEKDETEKRLRIISSLYGWLRPDDIVKPYRFDFTTPLAPGGKRFAAYWKNQVTECLLKELSANGHKEILDLMPGDATKCINWKQVKPNAKVFKVDFKEILPEGAIRTPNAGRLKTLRGQLLRQIIKENITTCHRLMEVTGENYYATGTVTPEGIILFHTA